MKCKKIASKNKKRVVQERGVKNIEGTESEEGTRESKGREPFGRFKGSGGKRNPPAVFLWDRKPVSFVRTKEMGLHKHAPQYTVHQKKHLPVSGGVAFYSSARRSRYRPYSVIFRPSAVSNS